MKEPITRRDVHCHIQSKWICLKHATDFQNTKQQDISNITTTQISRKEKAQLIISTKDNIPLLKEKIKLKYLNISNCITDIEGGTLIHLGVLNNPDAIVKATDAINHYYFHTLNHPSHRSNEFWKNFIEHFGVYTRNNLLPFTSSNTASTYNVEHQECVDTLLRNLDPLSISVNEFAQKYYGRLYEKLKKLSWGAFGPRPFGVFPMIAINYNTISDYHWDEHDEPNCLCFLVALGEFEGGELCFPQLQTVVSLKIGQVVTFSSRLLLHGNFPVTKGIRHSIVYFVHSSFFHHLRDFTEIYEDHNKQIERDSCGKVVPTISQQNLNDAQNLNKRIRLLKPKKNQIEIPDMANDKRRGNIGK